MVVSVMISKILGLAYVIPLTQLIHSVGLGYYSAAYSLYVLLLALSTSGFPTAMAKIISERLATRRYGDVEQLFRVTLRMVVILGIIACAVMWFGAPIYSHLVALNASPATTAAITLSVRAVAPSLLIIPTMSALRGYLQGFQHMEASGISQAVEQLFRVVFIVVGAYIVVKITSPGNIAQGAAVSTFGAFVGGLAALIVLMTAVRGLREDLGTHSSLTPTETAKAALRLLWQYALPVCLGVLVVPISQQVDTMTVPNLLSIAYHHSEQAMAEYGIYTRQALQLVNVPLAFAFAIGSSVLPAISQAHAQNNHEAVNRQVKTTFRSMFFIMFPTALVILLLARPIDRALFNSSQGMAAIASVSVMSVFSGLEQITTYMLQGLTRMYRPVRNMFIGVGVKLIFNLLLIRHFGIIGAAAGSTIGYLCSSTLNILAVRKYGSIRFSVWREISPALVATLPTGVVVEGLYQISKRLTLISQPVIWAWVQLLVILGISAVVYLLISMRLSAVTATEVRALPGIGSRLALLAQRIQPQQK